MQRSADSWPLHGASSKPYFSLSCCIRCTSICEFKFDRQMSSGATDQANVLQFAIFRDHGWFALYPRWQHVIEGEIFQPPPNDGFPTVKELSKIFWRKIRTWTYDFHLFIHNFKSHAALQKCVWCIAARVLRLLKPTLNYRLDCSLISKIWIKFLDMLIMLNNGFHKNM